jgi:hypothetical protein
VNSDSKRSTEWYLEPWAEMAGVHSTTRYRTKGNNKSSRSGVNRGNTSISSRQHHHHERNSGRSTRAYTRSGDMGCAGRASSGQKGGFRTGIQRSRQAVLRNGISHTYRHSVSSFPSTSPPPVLDCIGPSQQFGAALNVPCDIECDYDSSEVLPTDPLLLTTDSATSASIFGLAAVGQDETFTDVDEPVTPEDATHEDSASFQQLLLPSDGNISSRNETGHGSTGFNFETVHSPVYGNRDVVGVVDTEYHHGLPTEWAAAGDVTYQQY